MLTHKKIKEVSSQYILGRYVEKKYEEKKYNFIRCTYGGMEGTPLAKHFDKLCNATPTETYGRFAAYMRSGGEWLNSVHLYHDDDIRK
jgi:hypothetical protein